MNDNWRFTAVFITKYDPVYRDAGGIYTKDEWIGFFQIGKTFPDGTLTFETYVGMEEKYIEAAVLFFKYHNCKKIVLRNIEKKGFSDYEYGDRDALLAVYESIDEGMCVDLDMFRDIVRLILREFIWTECFCSDHEDIAVRFGYDFYMYFNSNLSMVALFDKIRKIGLYID